jgi:hypothetical protein
MMDLVEHRVPFSGTILQLKQGTDPHPQGTARRGTVKRMASHAVRFLFVYRDLEEQ